MLKCVVGGVFVVKWYTITPTLSLNRNPKKEENPTNLHLNKTKPLKFKHLTNIYLYTLLVYLIYYYY